MICIVEFNTDITNTFTQIHNIDTNKHSRGHEPLLTSTNMNVMLPVEFVQLLWFCGDVTLFPDFKPEPKLSLTEQLFKRTYWTSTTHTLWEFLSLIQTSVSFECLFPLDVTRDHFSCRPAPTQRIQIKRLPSEAENKLFMSESESAAHVTCLITL